MAECDSCDVRARLVYGAEVAYADFYEYTMEAYVKLDDPYGISSIDSMVVRPSISDSDSDYCVFGFVVGSAYQGEISDVTSAVSKSMDLARNNIKKALRVATGKDDYQIGFYIVGQEW